MLDKNITKLILALFFFVIFLFTLRTFWTLSHTFTPDFSVYYQAARNMLSSTSVYTGKVSFTLFAYPLVSGLFFIPLAFLPYQIAQTLFLIFSFLALSGISILAPIIILKKRNLFLSTLIFSFSYLSFPTKFTLGMGQVNLVAYFFLLLSFLFYFYSIRSLLIVRERERPYLQIALFFTVACILKPILGFLILFFIFQRKWKIMLYIFLFLVGSFFLSLLIDHHALQDYFYYLQHVIPEVSRPVGKEIYYNQGFMSFVFREIPNQQFRLIVSYLGMAAILGSGLIVLLKNNRQYVYQFALLLSMLPLLDTLSWQHHFIVLIFPFFYAAYTFSSQKKWVKLGILFLAYILVSWNFALPEIYAHFPINIFLSNTFFGSFFLFVLLLTTRPTLPKQA